MEMISSLRQQLHKLNFCKYSKAYKIVKDKIKSRANNNTVFQSYALFIKSTSSINSLL